MQFDTRGSKIMVVDNDRTTLEMITIRLDVAGYHPIAARTAQAALEVLGHTRPDALILERDLPSIDGISFLQAMAQIQERRPIPVLLVGRALSPEDVKKAVGLGVRDCLTKPFSGAVVLERLNRMLRKGHPHPSTAAAVAADHGRQVVYLSA